MHYAQLISFYVKSALDISPISDYALISMISDLLCMIGNSVIYIIV